MHFFDGPKAHGKEGASPSQTDGTGGFAYPNHPNVYHTNACTRISGVVQCGTSFGSFYRVDDRMHVQGAAKLELFYKRHTGIPQLTQLMRHVIRIRNNPERMQPEDNVLSFLTVQYNKCKALV